MIRGMSYNNGIFYLNKNGIAHASIKGGQITTHFFPNNPAGYLFLFTRLVLSVPSYLILFGLLLLLFIERPSFLFTLLPSLSVIPEIPYYVLVLYLFFYHFIFPAKLKKYHGAEHKVFSYKGRKHLSHSQKIAEANIVNRYCSTNNVVLFFIFFLISFPFVNGWIATLFGWFAMVFIPRFWKWGDEKIFFPISAFLQKKVTTASPDESHLKVAILSYMSLQAKRALTEEEVWADYEKELEAVRLAGEERKRKLEQERIVKLLVEQEQKEMMFDQIRDRALRTNLLYQQSQLSLQEKIVKI